MILKKVTKQKLLDLIREQIRLKHFSTRIDKTCTYWTKQYVYSFNKKPLNDTNLQLVPLLKNNMKNISDNFNTQ